MADNLPNSRIPGLPPTAVIKAGYMIPIWSPETDITYRFDVSQLIVSDTTENFEYVSDTTYNTLQSVTYSGKWWQALQNVPINIVPGSNPAYWLEVNKAPSGFVFWQSGIYSENNVFVLRDISTNPLIKDIQAYYLVNPTRPFVSSNFTTELTAGDWVKIFNSGGGSGGTFTSNVVISLANGGKFGKYSSGQTAPWAGLTAVQAILDAVSEYINPSFLYFAINGQPNIVETGTTLFGTRQFNWGVSVNSGTVTTIDIKDLNTNTNLVVNTPNDGNQNLNLNSIQLTVRGQTQSWKATLHDTNTVQNIDSNTFTVVARDLFFFGEVTAASVNSGNVRALNFEYYYLGVGTYDLPIGTTLTMREIALPPGVTLVSAIDVNNLMNDITDDYELQPSTINVLNAGGINVPYNIYRSNDASVYTNPTIHRITISN